MTAPVVAWSRRLHVKLAATAVIGLVLVCGLLWWGQDAAQQHRADAYSQWENLRLARYIADRQSQPFIDAQGHVRAQGLADTAMYIGMIHPALEAYLLDPQGRILQHTLGTQPPVLSRVDVSALAPLWQQVNPELPLYGDDPRRPTQPNLVSVAPLPDAANVQGYLYVVLRGEKAQALQAQSFWDQQRAALTRGVVGVLALGALLVVGVQWGLTRRLGALTDRLQRFRQERAHMPGTAFSAAADLPQGDELDWLVHAATELQQRVLQQFKQLEDAEALRRELVSNISHDLHTPLANVQGYLETLLLRRDQLQPDQRDLYLRTCLQHCRVLGRRVGELFELSKLESGHTVLHIEPFAIADLLNDVVQSYTLTAQEQQVQLRLSDNLDATAMVRADIRLIERVLQNLVANALRHTPAGGHVELGMTANVSHVSISVLDTGSGIDPQDLPHIFDRYWSSQPVVAATEADTRRRLSSMSAGLGLAIAQRILILHGSVVDVQSRLAQGSRFSFVLPLEV